MFQEMILPLVEDARQGWDYFQVCPSMALMQAGCDKAVLDVTLLPGGQMQPKDWNRSQRTQNTHFN